MSEILVKQVWQRKSGIPADAVENTWVFHYGAGAPDDVAFDDIADHLDEFWNVVGPGRINAANKIIGRQMSESGAGVELFFYDITAHLDGSPYGSPVGMRTLSIGNSGLESFPAECALVLSYHQPYSTDVEFGAGGLRPRARDRGRLYLGPLSHGCVAENATTKEIFVDSACMGDVTASAERLMGYVDTTRWAQWSRANASVGIVAGGWVDNAVDIQRRRGNKATSRVEFS